MRSTDMEPPPKGLRSPRTHGARALTPRNLTPASPLPVQFPDGLRLGGRGLWLRRQRLGAAAAREGLQRRCARVRQALHRRRLPEVDLGPAPVLLGAASRDARD